MVEYLIRGIPVLLVGLGVSHLLVQLASGPLCLRYYILIVLAPGFRLLKSMDGCCPMVFVFSKSDY